MVVTKKVASKRVETKKAEKKVVVKAPQTVKLGGNGDDSADRLKSILEARRASKQEDKPELPLPPAPVSLGPVDKIVDVLINPTPDKILEFTDFDRNQVTLIPQIGVMDDVWDYCQEIAAFRYNAGEYKKKFKKEFPSLPNPTRRFVHLLAQCRRSLGGKTQKALEDLALADLETRQNEDGLGGVGGHDFED